MDAAKHVKSVREWTLGPGELVSSVRAWHFGYGDGADGEPFAPEVYFANLDDQRDYALGFGKAAPDNDYCQFWLNDYWQAYIEDNEQVGYDQGDLK